MTLVWQTAWRGEAPDGTVYIIDYDGYYSAVVVVQGTEPPWPRLPGPSWKAARAAAEEDAEHR